ncbi:MAG: hypothetical protein LBL07_05210 [Tannerella sp.]|jgi:hypothetical protein|nr:hypothetical protein [Tannerella sp.]
MDNRLKEKRLLLKIRLLVLFFIVALTGSGLTAFPLETELELICKLLGVSPGLAAASSLSGLQGWMAWIYEGVKSTKEHYPFLLYGTDWLAFAHIMIAVAFTGLYCQPVRNKWLIYWGMIMCAGIIPAALICGAVRSIPFYWQLIDCSFGIFGFIPLYVLHRLVKNLESPAKDN